MSWVRMALLVVACAWVAPPALAQPAEAPSAEVQSRRATGIARTVQSPFCPGKTLDACPSPSAAEWRSDIRAWVARGDSDRAIRERLQARVPAVNLDGQPMGASSWWLPVFAILASTGVLLAWVARHVRRAPLPPASEGEEDPEVGADASGLDARLKRELDALDR